MYFIETNDKGLLRPEHLCRLQHPRCRDAEQEARNIHAERLVISNYELIQLALYS
jgi:hypothetical protein